MAQLREVVGERDSGVAEFFPTRTDRRPDHRFHHPTLGALPPTRALPTTVSNTGKRWGRFAASRSSYWGEKSSIARRSMFVSPRFRAVASAWSRSSWARSVSPGLARVRSIWAHSSRVRASQVGAPIRS